MARSLAGATNGNVAVVKSMIGEMTDSTNQARAFGFVFVDLDCGVFDWATVGWVFGQAAEQYPAVFGREGTLGWEGCGKSFVLSALCGVSVYYDVQYRLGATCLEERCRVSLRRSRPPSKSSYHSSSS